MVSNGPAHQVVMRVLQILLLSDVLLQSALLAISQAQITLDGSLGPQGPLAGPNYRIGAELGQIRGSNLFQSFGQFNVRTGESATFTGPNTIANIVSRVTGGEPSAIDGRLRSEIAAANLYLLNPSGVLFGPNASLDVSGSFHVSTADFLRFADGATFQADLSRSSVLTVAPPAAFGFLGANPVAIAVQGSSLQVPDGQALSVVGGGVQIVGGRLQARGGRLQLASVASPGEVRFSPLELAPDLQVETFARLGRLELSQEAFLQTSGDGGGTVLLRGGDLLLENAFIAAANLGNTHSPGLGIDVQMRGNVTLTGGGLFSGVWGRGNGGRLSVSAPTGTVRVDGGFILTSSEPTSHGNVGEIRVEAGTLALTGGGQIGGLARGSGQAGNITVAARESVSISGRDTQDVLSGILSTAAGEPGRISLSAPTVTIDGGAVGAPSLAPGERAGDIAIEAGHLTLRRGGFISSGTQTEQNGGDITVKASESISISGFQPFSTGIIYSGISSATSGQGNAGRIAISTPRLTMDNGLIQADTFGAGNAGNIEVRGGRLTLTGGARISSSTSGSGRGGTVIVAATEALSIAGQDQDGFRSGLFSSTAGPGDAGRLVIAAPALTMESGSIVSSTVSDGRAGDLVMEVGSLTLAGGAQIASGSGVRLSDGAILAGRGGGGSLSITAKDFISISGRDLEGTESGLFSNTFGLGDAGRLFISTPRLTMDEGLIQAVATDSSRGNAGDIEVRVGRLTLTGGAQISSSTQGSGRGGTVTVVATDTITLAGHDRVDIRFPSGLFSDTEASGDAGNIVVEVGSLTLTDGAQIGSSTFGEGRGGTVTVTATDAIDIAGRDSGLFSNTFDRGDAGRLFISVPRLTMDEGDIQAGTARDSRGNAGSIDVRAGRLTLTSGAQIASSTFGEGRGGTVTVTATDAIAIAGRDAEDMRFASGLFSSTEGRGPGGDLYVAASHLQLSSGGTISARSSGAGDAGTIQLQVGETFRSQNGVVTTATEAAGGGTIALTAGRLVQLIDSELSTSVRGGGSDAGNLSLEAPFIISQGSQIIANAFGGRGGSIGIGGEVFLADPDSRVSASSALGIQGTVDIRAPVTSLSGAVAPLPQTFVNVAALLPARCTARLSGGNVSSLVVGGREGLPLDPSSLLPSPLALDERLTADPAATWEPRRQQSISRFTLLHVADQSLPRLQGWTPRGWSPAALARGCSK